MSNTSFLFSGVPNSQAGFGSPLQTTALNPAPLSPSLSSLSPSSEIPNLQAEFGQTTPRNPVHPSHLISNSNIAELVSLVTSQEWVSPFLSESDPNINTGLPAQPSKSNFSSTIEMDDSDEDVFATALANLKAANNKENKTTNEEIATSQQWVRPVFSERSECQYCPSSTTFEVESQGSHRCRRFR